MEEVAQMLTWAEQTNKLFYKYTVEENMKSLLPNKLKNNSKKEVIAKSGTKTGFTLIELLVNLVGIRERGADTQKKADLNQLKTALRLYYNDLQGYPNNDGSGNLLGCIDGVSVCDQAGGGELNSSSGTVYMKSTPEYNIYSAGLNNESFYIGVQLSNESDPDTTSSATECGVPGPTPGYFYVCTD